MTDNPPIRHRAVSSVTTDSNGIRQLHLECGHTVAHGNERAGGPPKWAACGRCRWGEPGRADPGIAAFYEQKRLDYLVAARALAYAMTAGAEPRELRRLQRAVDVAADTGD